MTFHDCFCGILFFCGTKYLICCMLCENGRTVQKSLDLVHAVPDRVPECWENREGAKTPALFILNLIPSNIYERWSCWKLKMQFQTEWIQNQIRLVRKTERYTRKGIPLRKEQICKFYIYYNFWMNFFDTLRQLKHHLLHLSLSKSGNVLSRAKNYM